MYSRIIRAVKSVRSFVPGAGTFEDHVTLQRKGDDFVVSYRWGQGEVEFVLYGVGVGRFPEYPVTVSCSSLDRLFRVLGSNNDLKEIEVSPGQLILAGDKTRASISLLGYDAFTHDWPNLKETVPALNIDPVEVAKVARTAKMFSRAPVHSYQDALLWDGNGIGRTDGFGGFLDTRFGLLETGWNRDPKDQYIWIQPGYLDAFLSVFEEGDSCQMYWHDGCVHLDGATYHDVEEGGGKIRKVFQVNRMWLQGGLYPYQSYASLAETENGIWSGEVNAEELRNAIRDVLVSGQPMIALTCGVGTCDLEVHTPNAMDSRFGVRVRKMVPVQVDKGEDGIRGLEMNGPRAILSLVPFVKQGNVDMVVRPDGVIVFQGHDLTTFTHYIR